MNSQFERPVSYQFHLFAKKKTLDDQSALGHRPNSTQQLWAFRLVRDGRRLSVTAESNRAASAAKAAVGPFQRNWSTSSKSGMSGRRVATVRKSTARSRPRL